MKIRSHQQKTAGINSNGCNVIGRLETVVLSYNNLAAFLHDSADGGMNIAWDKSKKIKVEDEKMLLTDNGNARRLFEQCQLKARTVVNTVIDWPDHDIWEFYWHECKLQNPLYKMGYRRVGCIGCPMAGKSRWKDSCIQKRYPVGSFSYNVLAKIFLHIIL